MDQMERELAHIKSAWDRMGTSRQNWPAEGERDGVADGGRPIEGKEPAASRSLTMPNEQRRRKSDAVRRSPARTGSRGAVTDDAIRSRAYQLYEARGGEPGADMDDWLRAERELREPTDGTDNEAAW